jgi:dihydrofolate reductase
VKTSVFVGVSVDGFIARPDGGLDFLDAGGNEAHGYEEFIATVDTLVMGRKTFETVLGFGVWPYGERRVVVLSSRRRSLSVAGSSGRTVRRPRSLRGWPRRERSTSTSTAASRSRASSPRAWSSDS